MIKLFYGDEQFLAKKEAMSLVEQYQHSALDYRVVYDWTDEISDFALSFPFELEKKVVLLKLNKLAPNESFEDFLTNYATSDNFIVIVIANEVDNRTKLFSLLKDNSVCFNKLSKTEFFTFCRNCAASLECCFENDMVIEAFLDSSDYLGDGNLEMVSTYIRQLSFMGPVISMDTISLVTEDKRYEVWGMIDALVSRDPSKLFSLAENLLDSGESPLNIIGAMLRNLRISYKLSLCGGDLKPIGVKFFKKLNVDASTLHKLICLFTEASENFKKGGNSKLGLYSVLAMALELL